MEVKPVYNHTELGAIPEDWNVQTLNNISTISRLAGAEYTAVWQETPNGEIIALRGFNIGQGRIIERDLVHISNKLSLRLKRSRLCKGDVVYPCVGSIGNAVVIDEDSKYHIQQNIARITPYQNIVSSQYLAYYLMSALAAREVERFTSSSSQPSVLVGSLRQYRVPLPSTMGEQRAIAEALSNMDELLWGLDRLIAKKRDLKQAAMQKLITGKTRLSGFSCEWEFKRLGELIIRLPKTTRPSAAGRAQGKYPFFTNSTKPCDKYLDEFDFDMEAIIANTGGEAYFNYFNGQFAAMADCLVFKTSMLTQFLYFVLKFNEQHINDMGFTGSGIRHLDKKYFFDYELHFPPTLAEQSAIAAVLSDMDTELAALEARRDKTRALKQAMMQELLTGKTRLVPTGGGHA